MPGQGTQALAARPPEATGFDTSVLLCGLTQAAERPVSGHSAERGAIASSLRQGSAALFLGSLPRHMLGYTSTLRETPLENLLLFLGSLTQA